MNCPHCGKEVRETARVCGYCGKPLQVTPAKCRQCGMEPREGARVCGYCGHPLGSETKSPEPAASPIAEPKTAPPATPPPGVSKAPEPPQTGREPAQPETVPPVMRGPEPKPEPKPKALRSKAASLPQTSRPKTRRRSAARSFWIGIPLLIALLAGGGYYLVQTQGWLADEVFSGAIGNWEGRDGSDGSYHTMSIRRTLAGSYRIVLVDEGASVCNGGSGRATIEGKPRGNYLSAMMEFACDADPGRPLGLTRIGLTYNALNSTVIDSWGDKWTRR